MHIKNFLYAAPHRELPAFLALNGGKVKKKVGKDEICKWICFWFSDFVWQTFIYKIAECIGQNAAEPDGEAHRPGKCNQADIFRIRRAIRAAAGSASIKNGIGQVFLSVMRERTKPGQIVLT